MNRQPPMALGSAQGSTKHLPNLTNVNFTRTPESRACGFPSQDDLTASVRASGTAIEQVL